MIYVDLSKLKLPDDVKKELEEATLQLSRASETDRKKLIGQPKWSLAKPCLAAILGKDNNPSDYKCWYCETKDLRFDYHVDHFRPKGRVKNKGSAKEPGYWWLAFDYTNFRLSCGYCNTPHKGDDGQTRGKWDQFPLKKGSARALGPEPDYYLDEDVPLLLDPTKRSDPGLLSFDDEGLARPLYDDGFANLKARTSIDILNLNEVRIVEARRQLSLRCKQLVEDGNREFIRFNHSGSPIAGKAFTRICESISELVVPSSEFSAMARYCFQSTGQPWVQACL